MTPPVLRREMCWLAEKQRTSDVALPYECNALSTISRKRALRSKHARSAAAPTASVPSLSEAARVDFRTADFVYNLSSNMISHSFSLLTRHLRPVTPLHRTQTWADSYTELYAVIQVSRRGTAHTTIRTLGRRC